MRQFTIITLYGLFNYGNRLQNYALHQKALDFLSDGATFAVWESPIKSFTKKIAKIFLKKESGKVTFKTLDDFKKAAPDQKRKRSFLRFTKQYIPSLSISNSQAALSLKSTCDFFIAGSDQIWNPLFWDRKNPWPEFNRYLLTFAPPEKRIAYAARFGIPVLPQEWEKPFAKELSKFKAISVREESGAQIVKKLIGKDVPVVLDPTLLLTAQEWRKIETHTLSENKKYILTYFLGPQPESVRIEVQQKADAFEAEIIEMMDWHSPYYTFGPDGFLEMIDHAQMVFTDSFHGTVFCILFHRPFYVYQRLENDGRDANMFSRIDTLLSKTGLTQCAREHRPPTEEEFARADELLEKEREFSMNFLRAALFDTTDPAVENK